MPQPTPTAPVERTDEQAACTPTVERPQDLATVLSRMTFAERLRAYRSGAFSPHELALAAAHDPDSMPLLNGEFEWIAANLE